MITVVDREAFLAELRHETAVSKHLWSKVPSTMAGYRPSPSQRSMLELLQYLSICGIAPLLGSLAGDINTSNDAWRRAPSMSFEEFPEAMDRQLREIVELLESFGPEDFERETDYFGETLTLGRALMKTTYGWMVAYRMQLFLYAKACCAPTINTVNNWFGYDAASDE